MARTSKSLNTDKKDTPNLEEASSIEPVSQIQDDVVNHDETLAESTQSYDVDATDNIKNTDCDALDNIENTSLINTPHNIDSTPADSTDTQSNVPEVSIITKETKHTNRLMTVYALPNCNSTQYSFLGTYVLTGVITKNYKQVICSVPGLGRFVGFIKA